MIYYSRSITLAVHYSTRYVHEQSTYIRVTLADASLAAVHDNTPCCIDDDIIANCVLIMFFTLIAVLSVLFPPEATAAADQDGRYFGVWETKFPQDFNYYDHPDSVPSHRYNHVSFADHKRQRMIVVHGYMYNHRLHTADWQGDVWAFYPNGNYWSRLHNGAGLAPTARYGMCGVQPNENDLYIFGGDDGQKVWSYRQL